MNSYRPAKHNQRTDSSENRRQAVEQLWHVIDSHFVAAKDDNLLDLQRFETPQVEKPYSLVSVFVQSPATGNIYSLRAKHTLRDGVQGVEIVNESPSSSRTSTEITEGIAMLQFGPNAGIKIDDVRGPHMEQRVDRIGEFTSVIADAKLLSAEEKEAFLATRKEGAGTTGASLNKDNHFGEIMLGNRYQ